MLLEIIFSVFEDKSSGSFLYLLNVLPGDLLRVPETEQVSSPGGLFISGPAITSAGFIRELSFLPNICPTV